MAYNINKTDGTLLVTVADGGLNSAATTISLIGRDLTHYGEILNENLVHMMESFANSSSPQNPLRGQLWYDTDESILMVYNGTSWYSSGADLGEFTVAALPNAVANPNAYALATNASGGRTVVRSDGTNWKVVVIEGATVTV